MNCPSEPWRWTWWGVWYPWAEANTGFLSVMQSVISIVALGVAISFFLHEQKRANQAEADARRLRDEAALERAREAERVAIERTQATRLEREEHVRAFGYVTGAVMMRFQDKIFAEQVQLQQWPERDAAYVSRRLEFRPLAESVRDTLLSLLSAAPRDPALIYEAQNAVEVATRICQYAGPETVGGLRILIPKAGEDLQSASKAFSLRIEELAPVPD
ncbi:hypothetical protein [Caulobacter sp. CCG-8]|uniref:hypothetical protein n=1 Tax=Caulobacter sp. CCG-8 TaxID=3127958 RepID=UPI00307F7D8E